MLTLVVDCSMTMAWHFPDEQTPETDAILKGVSAEAAISAIHLLIIPPRRQGFSQYACVPICEIGQPCQNCLINASR